MNNEKNNIQSELRERFNPDGSILRRHQMRMLDMLLDFDAICKKHNIPYWLSSGTMLGCARHKGFIPWDDDMDVEMLREDFARLMKVLPTELPSHLAIQTNDTDPNYFLSYPKLRDLRSYLEETTTYDKTYKYQGVYIDIFLLEKMPDWVHGLSCLSIGHIYKVLKDSSLSDEARMKKASKWYHLNHRFIYPVMRLLSKLYITKKIHHTFGTPYPAERYRDEIFPLSTGEYEGHLLPVPHDSDKYLRRMYGDYMKLPNLDNIHPHYSKISLE